MKTRSKLLTAICVLAGLSSSCFEALAERVVWNIAEGKTIKGELIGYYASTVFIDTGNRGTFYIHYSGLDNDGQKRVDEWFQEFRNRRKAEPALVSESESKLTRFLSENLVEWKEGEVQSCEFASKEEPEFYAFYYSAHWCGPCRRFTPKLRVFYKTMRMLGYHNFEIVFVSSDTSAKSMAKYMKEEQMPWPAVKYGKRIHNTVSRYKGSGIPCLVVTDRWGNMLFHSYEGSEYVGPSVPRDKLKIVLENLKALDRSLGLEENNS